MGASAARRDWLYELGIRASSAIGTGLVIVIGVVALSLIDIGDWYLNLLVGVAPGVGLLVQKKLREWIRLASGKIWGALTAFLKATVIKGLVAVGKWASKFRVVRVIAGALLLVAVAALFAGAIVVSPWASVGVALFVAGVIGSVLWYRLGPDGPREWKAGGKYNS